MFVDPSGNFGLRADVGSPMIIGGVSVDDELRLDVHSNQPSNILANLYYNTLIIDDFGKVVFRNWADGNGKSVYVEGERWTNFIKDNQHVKERIVDMIPEAISNGGVNSYAGQMALSRRGWGGYHTHDKSMKKE